MPELERELASLRLERPPPERSDHRRTWLALAVVVASVGAGTVALRPRTAAVSRPATAQPTRAETPTGESGPSPRAWLTASGYIVARRQAVVSATVPGRLAEIRVEEGSRVRRGELLARLDSEGREAEVQRARAGVEHATVELEESRRRLALAEALLANGGGSAAERDAGRGGVRLAEADLHRAEAELRLSEAGLRTTRITAPFAGTVVKRMAEVGESVAPVPPGVSLSTSAGAIVAIADLSALEVEVDVGEASVARLSPGQPAEVTVEALAARAYRATVRRIMPTADRTRATVQIRVAIVAPDDLLEPEMSARVAFLDARAETGSPGATRESTALATARPGPPARDAPRPEVTP